jgi:hypothetical protein
MMGMILFAVEQRRKAFEIEQITASSACQFGVGCHGLIPCEILVIFSRLISSCYG